MVLGIWSLWHPSVSALGCCGADCCHDLALLEASAPCWRALGPAEGRKGWWLD